MRSSTGALLALGGLLLLASGAATILFRGPGSVAAEPEATPRASVPDATPGLAPPPARDAASAPPAVERAARREVDVGGFVGYVLSLEDASPVPDAWAELCGPPGAGDASHDARVLAEAGTDATGRFVLPWPQEAGSRVRVAAPYGWTMAGDAWASAPSARDGRPLVFRARRLRRSSLELVLHDVRTADLVPHYVLGVRNRDTGTRLRIPTDDQGRGASELELEEGPYELVLADDPRMASAGGVLQAPLAFDGRAGAPRRLEIPVGPTYRLDLHGPPGLSLELLHAFLAEDEREIQLADPSDRTPVRSGGSGELPWVRFHASDVWWSMDSGQPLVLVVRDQARTLRGTSRVAATWGVHLEPVRIDLQAAGALSVEVRDEAAEPVEAARVGLSPGENASGAWTRTGPDGVARYPGLAAGDYSLRVAHDRLRAAEVRVFVALGADKTVVLALEPALVGGLVEGRVVGGERLARDGRSLWRSELRLRSTDGAGRSLALPLRFEEDGGALIASFRFEEVPAGEYVLQFNRFDPTAWWPQAIRVRPPARGLELREVPWGAIVSPALKVVDRPSGRELANAWLWLEAGGILPVLRGVRSARRWVRVHRGASLQWGVAAPGHLPRFGSEADLQLAGGLLTATVALERGWGVRLDVVGPDGRPLGGASVVVDGEELGRTDGEGRFLLRAQAMPETVEVRYRDWPPRQGPSDALALGQPVCTVRMSAE